jgi:predicted regulator of Ras-like GTPase activity (Roadblock/LC7/MglB family)
LAQLQLALPVQFLEEAMKRGKVAFPWRTLRSWLKPAQPQSVSAHDGAILELPMKVVTPLFLARGKDAARPQQKVALDESIPNLFFGFPQPNAPAPQENPTDTKPALPASRPVSKPMDTNYYIWNDTADSAKVDVSEFKRQPSPETNFISRCATPNEVVSRAAAMDGVAGALVALPDGLMVASKLSPDLNGDTLAAFLPHIFGKVSQCTKELRMGELNNLNFTVGNVPWKIFRVNAIFFAAFGRAGQGLPTAELAALAGELDRKKQQ